MKMTVIVNAVDKDVFCVEGRMFTAWTYLKHAQTTI